MNQFEEQFKRKIESKVPQLIDIICYNFGMVEDGNEYECLQDNGLFILHTQKNFSYIKIKYNISSDKPEVQGKMYYAEQPKDQFSEENSRVLGFFNGEDYEEIIYLGGQNVNSFRFDFGYEPIRFKINNFEMMELTLEEIDQEKMRLGEDKVFSTIIKRITEVVSCIKQKGVREGIKYVLKNDSTKGDLSTQQVVEPYRVKIMHPLEENRKRVLHIIENFHTGGSSRLIIDIIEYYGHKYDHKIFTMAYRGDAEFLDIDVEMIDVENKNDVLKRIEEYNPDIIHVHIWKSEWYHKVFDILDKTYGRTIIENINTPIAPITRDYIRKYVFVSKYVVNNFYNVGDPRSIVIYPGSNFNMFTRELRDGYLANDTIGMVYRLGFDKLNSKSIDVFIKTVKKRPKTKAIIVGGGPQYDYFVEKVKKAGVFDSFVFTGYVPYVDLPKWYEKFTIFVAPVWQESFGQVSPFAMSMGMPVAGYNIGALNEIINNEALLAEPGNSDELSDKLVDLLDKYDKCVEIGRINQHRAQSLFGVQKMVDDYFSLRGNHKIE